MGCANSPCQNCNETCNVKQNLCSISSQQALSYGGSFSWPSTESIPKAWTSAAWNQLKGMLDTVYARGDTCSSGGEDWGANTFPSIGPNDVITADLFNQAADAINKIYGSPTVPSVGGGGDGSVVRDYHLANMQERYNTGQISTSACDECNVECDAECDACIGCVECEGVQHYSTCYDNCYGSCYSNS